MLSLGLELWGLVHSRGLIALTTGTMFFCLVWFGLVSNLIGELVVYSTVVDI